MTSNSDKRAAFVQSLKVNNSSSSQSNSAKKAQVSSNNSSSSNKAGAPDRQRAKGQGRGNER